MKKIFSKILMFVLTLTIVLSLVGCAGRNSEVFEPDLSDLPKIDGVDVEEEIDAFEEDAFNVIDIESGKKKNVEKLNSNNKKYYTTDDSIATVSDKGVVKAKEKGACYILAVRDFAGSKRVEVYKIMVDAPEKGFFASAFEHMPKDFMIVWVLGGIVSISMIVFVIIILVKTIKANKTEAPYFNAPPTQGYAPMQNNVNAAPPVAKVCSNCGQQAEGAFCPYCGNKLS